MYDVAIIGAGVIGASIARELSRYDINLLVIDKEEDVASGTTKANSAIVHGGFDAKPGTMKAKLNVLGNAMFDKLSQELNFPFKRNGSLVVCFDKEDVPKLKALKQQGIENGVKGLEILTHEEVLKKEPNLSDEVVAALYAPNGGIVCPYEMTIALAENAKVNGADFKLGEKVIGIEKEVGQYKIELENKKGEKSKVTSRVIVNAAGLYGDEINSMVSKVEYSITPRRGEYCLLDRAAGNMVQSTIFQLPTVMGKGVLVTPTVDGNLLVGPTAVDMKDKNDLSTTAEGLKEVIEKGRKSVKSLPMNQVITSFTGLRATEKGRDFVIKEAEDAKGFVNVIGIESPGLSSAPAIAVIATEIVKKIISPKEKENFIATRKKPVKFRELSDEDRDALIKERPEYGNIICRCETVTEGEIIDAIRAPLGATTVDGIKRRTRAGMGRCQAGFCITKVVDILSRELHIDRKEITKYGEGSNILTGKIKDNF